MARLGAAVNVVTTDGSAGRCGFTASAVCAITDEPPTLLVCMNRSSAQNPVARGQKRGEKSSVARLLPFSLRLIRTDSLKIAPKHETLRPPPEVDWGSEHGHRPDAMHQCSLSGGRSRANQLGDPVVGTARHCRHAGKHRGAYTHGQHPGRA
jgi:hypothetical protein